MTLLFLLPLLEGLGFQDSVLSLGLGGLRNWMQVFGVLGGPSTL